MSVADLVVAPAVVRRGRLFIQNRRHFDEQIKQMRETWQLEVSVKRLRATRSQQANKYYWSAVIGTLVRHCDDSYTPEEMHALLKAKFIPKTVAIHDGNGEIVFEYVLGGSTRTMDQAQFGEYIERIRQWADETLGCYIPSSDEAAL